MSNLPTTTTPFTTQGLREICEVKGRHFRQGKGTQQCTEYIPDKNEPKPVPQDADSHLYLSLIHEKQNEGEPLHWSLYVAHENQPGHSYQVTGDAELMSYVPSMDVVDATKSESFLTLYQLAALTEQQAMVVKEVADNEPPPRAVNRQAVVENCQGWAVRVIAKLVEKGIVLEGKLKMAVGMLESVWSISSE